MHPLEGLAPLLGDDSDQVSDRLPPGERASERGRIEDIADTRLDGMVVAVARGLTPSRQHGHIVLAAQQLVDEMRADETRSPRDENFHF